MILVENLFRNYADFCAVNDVSFQIERGEVVGLLGHNGAGKTTIMKMLTGYLEADQGQITIDQLSYPEDILNIQSKIGYLPENVPLYPEMYVVEYLEYIAQIHHVPKEKQKEAIARAIQRTSLEGKANAVIDTLSKGYKQRVGIAQAILHDPEILILDEPTNGLDPSQIQEIRDLIIDLAQHSTVILSTHIMQEVEAVCDRVLILQNGRLVLDSSLAEIKSEGAVLLSVDQPESMVSDLKNKLTFLDNLQLVNEDDGVFTYTLQLKPETAKSDLPKIADQVSRNGWKLYNFGVKEQSLESVFKSINQA